jgi:hypothetical protein
MARASGLTFHVLDVHIPFHKAGKFARAIESYSQRVGGVPLLVAGDFNTSCRAYPRRDWHSNDPITVFSSPKAHFVLPNPATERVYTHVNHYINVGKTTTRMLDALDHVVLYGARARMAQTFRLATQ